MHVGGKEREKEGRVLGFERLLSMVTLLNVCTPQTHARPPPPTDWKSVTLKGMWRYIRAKFRIVTKYGTKQ